MKHPARFVGIDGEGRTLADGSHIYTMLCASTNEYVMNPDGLSSWQCFSFLLRLKQEHTGAQFVGFSFNYDVNMMLKDVPKRALKELWEDHTTKFRHAGIVYFLEWIPTKIFHIRAYHYGVKLGSVQVWDVFGFFQKSFVKTLEEWGIGSSAEVSSISAMKDSRSSFTQDATQEILAYCFSECRLLVSLMDTLEAAFIEAGIYLDGYHGAGAAATSLMRQEHVKQYVTRLDPEVEDKSMRAYFGGRTEIFRVGEVGFVWNYDINSAYPAATQHLPGMHGEWNYVRQYDASADYALWHVRWDTQEPTLAPLPYRLDNSIRYSRNGTGWYHSVELRAAIRHYGRWLDIDAGYVFVPTRPDNRPFAFVPGLYNERRRLKESGSRAEKPIKLAINSIYGKLAQGYGNRDKAPPYQSYFWAGFVTASTRAAILDAVYPRRESLVGIATDGIFCEEPIDGLTIGKGLGEWDAKQASDFFNAQPGVYTCIVGDAEIKRNRGFSSKELDFAQLRTEYALSGMGASVTYSVVRFVGYGASSADRPWRTWSPQQRRLTINAGNKFPYRNTNRLVLGSVPDGRESDRYTPKMTWTDFDGYAEMGDEIEAMDS